MGDSNTMDCSRIPNSLTRADLMRLDVPRAEHLVDITSIRELQTFNSSGTSELVFGALAR